MKDKATSGMVWENIIENREAISGIACHIANLLHETNQKKIDLYELEMEMTKIQKHIEHLHKMDEALLFLKSGVLDEQKPTQQN